MVPSRGDMRAIAIAHSPRLAGAWLGVGLHDSQTINAQGGCAPTLGRESASDFGGEGVFERSAERLLCSTGYGPRWSSAICNTKDCFRPMVATRCPQPSGLAAELLRGS